MPGEPAFGAGILLILVGAFANGSFGLMLKFTQTWKWEHIWLLFSFFAMLFFPWLLGLITIESLLSVLASANSQDLLLVFLFGLGWGFGAVLYGLALKMLGLALSFAIVMGLTAAVGTLAPLILLHAHQVLTLKGVVITGGVLLLVVGVILSASAGQLRERAIASPENLGAGTEPISPRHPISVSSGKTFALGLSVALLSGMLSPMLNLSFAYGTPLAELAVNLGTQPSMAANVIWVVALSAGFFVNAGYCIYLIFKKRTGQTLLGQHFHYGLGLAMGVLWFSGIVFYGIGGSKLGKLGAVIGWPVMSSMSIITASFWGAVSGEWSGTGRKPLAVMCVSVLVLCAAMFIIGWANTVP